MVSEEDIIERFKRHGVRPTAVRILVWRALCDFDFAFAMSDVENVIPTVDRSTIFRSLTTFLENDMLHAITDGSGQQKYCLCQELDGCTAECDHVHLTCMVCGRTFCLKNQLIPPVQIPAGFRVKHVSYIVQGVCPHCGHIDVDGHRPECCCHNVD
ncbi:MAG: transcriptional repressor [Bacteroidales bacterium]|nr:transcriptional repressor [Bacteroidales bacterium]